MRVVFTSFGSLGDVMPFVALAQALRRRNHQSVFALPQHLVPLVERFNFECVAIGPDLGAVFQEMQVHITEGTFNATHVAERERLIKTIAPRVIQTLRDLCVHADLLVSVYRMPFVDIVYRLTQIRVVQLQVAYPGYEDPARVPHSATPNQAHLTSARTVPPHLLLYAFSRTILPPNSGWPPGHTTGFFFAEAEPFTPPPDLATFLQAGADPLVITLGSMAHADPLRVFALFSEAITRVGCRAIIQSSFADLARHIALPATVHVAPYLPHHWLFPHAACIIHHGGAGTTAATLRAGVPAIVIPHALDQFVLAQRAQMLGCVGGIIPYHALTVDALATSIAQTLANSQYHRAAQAVSAQVQAEPGVTMACDLIEQLLASATTPQRTDI